MDIRDNTWALGLPVQPNLETKWRDVARRLERILTEYKDKRAAERKKEMEGESANHVVDYETLLMLADNGIPEEYLDNLENFHDLSDWQIPSIRYVEAIETDFLWIRSIEPILRSHPN